MISSEYITTFADYKAAQTLFLKYRRDARTRYYFWMFGLPIATVLGLLSMWHESKLNDNASFGLAAWLTFCAAVGTVSIVILRPWNLRRCFKKLRNASGLTETTTSVFSFDESVVISAIKGRSEGRFYWTAIQGFAEDSAIALLFISKKRFLFIPKRAMTDQQWESLRQLVSEKGIT